MKAFKNEPAERLRKRLEKAKGKERRTIIEAIKEASKYFSVQSYLNDKKERG